MQRQNASVLTRLLLLVGLTVLALLGVWTLVPDPAAAPGPGGSPIRVPDAGPGPRPEVQPAPSARPDGPAPRRPRTGSVRGRVLTHDRRSVAAGTVRALQGTLLGLPGLQEFEDLGVDGQLDAGGSFELATVPATGQLVLRVDGEAFATFDAGPFTVAPGAQTDVGDLVAPLGLGLHGVVNDPQGRPVPQARVLLRYAMSAGTPDRELPEPVRAVVSDGEGLFFIPHVRRDPFLLDVTAAGFAKALVPGGVAPTDDAARIQVSVRLEPVRPLRGTVLGRPGRKPLAGARVVAVPIDPGKGRSETTTDKAGRFTFTDLSLGNYTVAAYRKGHSPAHTRTWANKTPDKELLLVLHARGSLEGVVLGANDQTMTHFDLRVNEASQRMAVPVPQGDYQRTVDRKGHFHLDDLQAGFYTLEIWAKGHAITLTEPIRVRQGEHVQGLVIRLQLAAALTGQVVNDLGEIVAGAAVSLHTNRDPDVDFLRGPQREPRMKRTRTDAEGRFALEELTEGVYQIEIDHPDHAILRVDDQAVQAAARRDAGTFEVSRSALVRGVLADGRGVPAGGHRVQLSRKGGFARQTRTNSRGEFLFDRVAPGSYTLRGSPLQQGFARAIQTAVREMQHPPLALVVLPGESYTHNVSLPD